MIVIIEDTCNPYGVQTVEKGVIVRHAERSEAGPSLQRVGLMSQPVDNSDLSFTAFRTCFRRLRRRQNDISPAAGGSSSLKYFINSLHPYGVGGKRIGGSGGAKTGKTGSTGAETLFHVLI